MGFTLSSSPNSKCYKPKREPISPDFVKINKYNFYDLNRVGKQRTENGTEIARGSQGLYGRKSSRLEATSEVD